jgi:hypothetical protein
MKPKADPVVDAEVEEVIDMERTVKDGRTVYYPVEIKPVRLNQIQFSPRTRSYQKIDRALDSFDRFLEGCEQGLNVIERVFNIMNPERPRRGRRYGK